MFRGPISQHNLQNSTYEPCHSASMPCICGNNKCIDPIVQIPRIRVNAQQLWKGAYLHQSDGLHSSSAPKKQIYDLEWHDNTYANRRYNKAFVTPLFRYNLPHLQPPGLLPAYNEKIPHETSYQREFTPIIAMRPRPEKNLNMELLNSPLHESFRSAQMKTVVRPFTAVPEINSSGHTREKASESVSSVTQDTSVAKGQSLSRKTPFEQLFNCTYFKSTDVSGPRGADAGFWPAHMRNRR